MNRNPIKIMAFISRPTRIAPVIALVLMVVLPSLNMGALLNQDIVDARNAEVEKIFNEAPYIIGDWIGEDVQVPVAAIEILRSNAILSRKFGKLDGGSLAELIIVHCSDVRDMQGHYPPMCYPANGWYETDTNDRQDFEVSFGNKNIPARIYHFKRIDGWGAERTTRVINFFILPNGEFTRELGAMRRIVSQLSLSIEGVAQVQVVTSGDMPLEKSIVAAEELLSGLTSVMTVLSQVRENDNSN